MDASGFMAPVARTPEDVFKDFRARRAGLIKALTTGKSPRASLACLTNPAGSGSLAFRVRWFSMARVSSSDGFLPLVVADVKKFHMTCDPGLASCSALLLLFDSFRTRISRVLVGGLCCFFWIVWGDCAARMVNLECIFSEQFCPCYSRVLTLKFG
jgi:hypothetical protein